MGWGRLWRNCPQLTEKQSYIHMNCLTWDGSRVASWASPAPALALLNGVLRPSHWSRTDGGEVLAEMSTWCISVGCFKVCWCSWARTASCLGYPGRADGAAEPSSQSCTCSSSHKCHQCLRSPDQEHLSDGSEYFLCCHYVWIPHNNHVAILSLIPPFPSAAKGSAMPSSIFVCWGPSDVPSPDCRLICKGGIEWVWNCNWATFWVLIHVSQRELWSGSQRTSRNNFFHAGNINPAVSIMVLYFCCWFFVKV